MQINCHIWQHLHCLTVIYVIKLFFIHQLYKLYRDEPQSGDLIIEVQRHLTHDNYMQHKGAVLDATMMFWCVLFTLLEWIVLCMVSASEQSYVAYLIFCDR